MRWFSLSLALLALLGVAFADSPSRTRKTYRNLYVRQHLAVPSAATCSDVDGDNTTDSILRTGDICVDSDDEKLCYYVEGEYYCVSEESGYSEGQRNVVTIFDDFLGYEAVEVDGHIPYDNYGFYTQEWYWVYFIGSSSPTPSSSNYIEPSNDNIYDNRLGVLRAHYAGECWWGVRTPTHPEKYELRLDMEHVKNVTLTWLMKISSPADSQLVFGLATDLMRAHGDTNYVEFKFVGPGDGGCSRGGNMQAYIACASSDSTNDVSGEYEAAFSPSWAVDEEWHKYQIVLSGEGTALSATFYKDGVEVGSCPANRVNHKANYMWVLFGNDICPGDSNTIFLDYVQMSYDPVDTILR